MSGSNIALRPVKVLSEGSLQVLRARGENPVLQNGFRVISNTSYMSEDSLNNQATVEIPDELDSVQTVKFLEFNDSTATIIWNQYLHDQQTEPDRADLFYTARDHVTAVGKDALYAHDDWLGLMRSIGMTSNFQSRIMDEEFVEMRLTASCKEWIIEMMEMREKFLQTLDAVISTPALGAKGKLSHLDVNGVLKPGPQIPKRGPSEPRKGYFKTGEPGPSTATASAESPNTLEGHKFFYKGGSLSRLQSVHKGNELNFVMLVSRPPGDFSALASGLYFTEHAEVAWKYASWAGKLVDSLVVPVGILKMAVPEYLLSSTREIYGDEWRKYVWGCRTRDVPKNLRYLAGFQWLVGPVCKQSAKQISKLKDRSELELWKLKSNETASQHFAGHQGTFDLLDTACLGKVWITALA